MKKKMKKVTKHFMNGDHPVLLNLRDDYVELLLYGYNGRSVVEFDTGYGEEECYKEEHFKSIQGLVDALDQMANYMHDWNAKNLEEKK